jgi:hypothetical protein
MSLFRFLFWPFGSVVLIPLLLGPHRFHVLKKINENGFLRENSPCGTPRAALFDAAHCSVLLTEPVFAFFGNRCQEL